MKYLHGFSKKEQDRLYFQSRLLKDKIFAHLDFSECKTIIEIGCGVGAQTEMLLRKYPKMQICAVDASPAQLERAKERFRKHPKRKQVEFILADAKNLPFAKNTFDGAFICWLLEHVPGPLQVVKEAYRVLRPRGEIFCNEVLNNTFFVDPYSPATMKYLFEFNDYQWTIAGDPFIGAKLGIFLEDAKFKKIETFPAVGHYDRRDKRSRRDFIELFKGIFMSAVPSLLKEKRVTNKLVSDLKKELSILKRSPEAVIYYGWMQARGRK